MKQSEKDWFRPLWRRVAVTAFIAVWAAAEWLWLNDQLFRWITLGALAYAVWSFFIDFDRGTPETPKPQDKDVPPEA